MTLVSAPPASVTVLQEPKVPQVPFERVAAARSTIERGRVEAGARVGAPSRVSGTEAVEYQGPPARSTDWPLGAVESGGS